jgi:phosphatidylserine/phosphatidylglycerophosphate/cardiolipin synthase-like enzyme
MPSVVVPEAAVAEAARSEAPIVFVPEMVPRNCKLDAPYKKKKIPPFDVSSDVIAYASPDSTFAVTKRLLDGARKSILIGIYDFTADHVKQLLLKAMQRGVKVQLMLDIDGESEQEVFNELELFGAECTPAPSCASKRIQIFRSSHEKVIVIDDEWSLVQSGNYSDNSIPLNVDDGGDPDHFSTGNRDMGVAIRAKPLAKFFRKILEADIAIELNGPQAAQALSTKPDTFLVEAAPKDIPKDLFPSKAFSLKKPLTIQPVMTPDNYMNVVPDLLGAAKKSVLIEQQYIRASQEHIIILLEAIAAARQKNPKLDVRIVLGKVFKRSELPKEEANLAELASTFKLKLGKHIRYINTNRFVHCHNKLIVIDGSGVLISSQNWSNAAVSENREAGVWLKHAGIAGYFQSIFESDWSTAVKDPMGQGPESIGPEALRTGGFVRVMAGDYAEV